MLAEESLDFRSLSVLEPKNVEDDLHDRYLAYSEGPALSNSGAKVSCDIVH